MIVNHMSFIPHSSLWQAGMHVGYVCSYCKDYCSSQVNSSTHTFVECAAVILKSAPVGFLNIAESIL